MLSFPLFALEPVELIGIVTVVAVGAFLVLVLSVLARYYKRCPSNRVLVIFGKTARDEPADCISGGARLVWPLLQDYAWLSLEPMRIESISLPHVGLNALRSVGSPERWPAGR